MQFFASVETVKVPLFGGEDYWILVKSELNAAETKRFQASALRKASRTINDDGGLTNELGFEFDLGHAAFEKLLLYLVDWNIPDASGKTVDIVTTPQAKRDAVKNLTPDVFDAIEAAIDAHVKAHGQEKKRLTA